MDELNADIVRMQNYIKDLEEAIIETKKKMSKYKLSRCGGVKMEYNKEWEHYSLFVADRQVGLWHGIDSKYHKADMIEVIDELISDLQGIKGTI